MRMSSLVLLIWLPPSRKYARTRGHCFGWVVVDDTTVTTSHTLQATRTGRSPHVYGFKMAHALLHAAHYHISPAVPFHYRTCGRSGRHIPT